MSSILEGKPSNNKKNEHALEQGNSSKEGESPHILVARMEEQ